MDGDVTRASWRWWAAVAGGGIFFDCGEGKAGPSPPYTKGAAGFGMTTVSSFTVELRLASKSAGVRLRDVGKSRVEDAALGGLSISPR